MFKKLFLRLETLCFGKWKTVNLVDNTIVDLFKAHQIEVSGT